MSRAMAETNRTHNKQLITQGGNLTKKGISLLKTPISPKYFIPCKLKGIPSIQFPMALLTLEPRKLFLKPKTASSVDPNPDEMG